MTRSYQFQFTSTDGLPIACNRWDSLVPPRGIVQIAHGLGEHVGRCLRQIRRDLPIYLFSGSEDPVGQQLEGVRVLIDRYHKEGVRNI